MPFSNPQTGPICVEGAEPGDALAVKIESIEPTSGQCVTRTSDPNQLAAMARRPIALTARTSARFATARFIGATR